MKKIQLTFANEIQEAQTLIITVEKDGVASGLQEIFIEDASGAGQAERWDYGIHGNTAVYDYLANNFRTAFNRDYNAANFNNGLTFTRVGNVLNLTSTDETVIFTSASGSAIDSGAVTFILSEPSAPVLPTQKLKYFFEFTDVKEITHRVEISNATFSGDAVRIYGSCSLEYSETKDTLESVRGSGLKIDLDANSNLTFSDLYSEEERSYAVEYFRDGVTLFNGWLSPEGIYQSLVSDKWVISLDCTDGLGFLKNLSYVEDATGLNFVGKQSLTKIVSNCLKRTKIQSRIYVGVDIFYKGLQNDVSIFDNVFYNSDRFVKDDNDTIMNCEEVLKSVLEPFGAVITAYKGEWLIYKPNSLVTATVSSFFGYDSGGDNLVVTRKNFDFRTVLGSQINGFYPHHVNANQQKTIKSSIGAYRINYKYGLVNSLILINPFTLSGSDGGFESTTKIVPASSRLKLTVNTSCNFLNNEGFSSDVAIKITNGTDTFYYNGSEWVETFSKMLLAVNGRFLADTSPTPINGDLSVLIPGVNTYPNYLNETGEVYVRFVIDIVPSSAELDAIGENHTFQRKLKPSSKIKDVKKVFNGDNLADTYYGTIYKADQTTPTSSWNRKGVTEEKPILKIMGEERMKMYGKPLQVYSGDIFGFFNYLNVATISGFNGVFMATSYSYNCMSNVTSVTYVEILNTDILEDVDYQKTFDYGNVVEPTIRG